MTVYASKPSKHGLVEIQNGGYQKYALVVDGDVVAQSDSWEYIKAQYDKYD